MSLVSLPTELIELIVNHGDVSAACSLRLASSVLNQKSLHVFRDRVFRTRSLSWTKHNLAQLVEISAHPFFGRALQHLSINATPRYSISLWQLRKRISWPAGVPSDPNNQYDKFRLQMQYTADQKEAHDLAAFFNETRFDQKCLQTVFESTQRLESVRFRYEGMDQKHATFQRRYCESSQHEMSRPFVSTMAAIAASGVQLKAILIDPTHNYGAISIGRLESLAPSLTRFNTAFEALAKLELNLRDWRHPSTGFELESTKAPFVVRFLKKARQVKHLSLSCYSSLDDNLIGDLASKCTFANLETCKLAHFRMNKAEDLAQFLEPSSTTLRSLNLREIVLRDDDSDWGSLLLQLATSEDVWPGLEMMELARLHTQADGLVLFGGDKDPRLRLGTQGLTGSWRADLLAQEHRFSEGAWGTSLDLVATGYPFIDIEA
jgi:hypothetical protein